LFDIRVEKALARCWLVGRSLVLVSSYFFFFRYSALNPVLITIRLNLLSLLKLRFAASCQTLQRVGSFDLLVLKGFRARGKKSEMQVCRLCIRKLSSIDDCEHNSSSLPLNEDGQKRKGEVGTPLSASEGPRYKRAQDPGSSDLRLALSEERAVVGGARGEEQGGLPRPAEEQMVGGDEKRGEKRLGDRAVRQRRRRPL